MAVEYVVCHYHEIALKGRNRKFFEEKLVANIKRVLASDSFEFVRRIFGRVLIKLTPQGVEKQKAVEQSLKKVFGLANFAFAVRTKPVVGAIKKTATILLKEQKFKTFRITARRAQKDFPFTSQQINEEVGEFIVKKLKKKVNLQNPDLNCFIEIVENSSFLYLEKIKGPGGLPTGVSAKAVVLLSGGIDSPVAAYQIMKRGTKVVFLHFHSFPYTDYASIEKTKEIIEVLRQYQGKTKLYLLPFAKIQEQILTKTPAKLRVILYRRMMMRIGQKIAEKEKALALVTGESIGQVASQTLENIRVIEEVVDLPVFRPLIGQDKQEIIDQAKEINTFKISILPHQDCCTRFVPKHPVTKARLDKVKKAEENLEIERLVSEAIKQIEIIVS